MGCVTGNNIFHQFGYYPFLLPIFYRLSSGITSFGQDLKDGGFAMKQNKKGKGLRIRYTNHTFRGIGR